MIHEQEAGSIKMDASPIGSLQANPEPNSLTPSLGTLKHRLWGIGTIHFTGRYCFYDPILEVRFPGITYSAPTIAVLDAIGKIFEEIPEEEETL